MSPSHSVSLLVAVCVLSGGALAKLQTPIAFNMAGVNEAGQCATILLVLYANIDSACSGRCRLTIGQTSSTTQHAEDAAVEHGTVLSSRIQESNTVALPRPDASSMAYSLWIACDSNSTCESTPSAWKMIHTPSSFHLQRSSPAQGLSDTADAESLLPISGCVFEMNSTFIHSLPSNSLTASAHSSTQESNIFQTWLLRTSLFVCCLIMQRASAYL